MLRKALSLSLLAILVLGNTVEAKPNRKYQIQGTFTIIRSENSSNFLTTNGDDSFCFGYGGYDDLGLDIPVTITDEQGKIIATGLTQAGQETERGCVMSYVIKNVPKANFYSVEVGRRGKLTYSFDEMNSQKWKVHTRIGETYY